MGSNAGGLRLAGAALVAALCADTSTLAAQSLSLKASPPAKTERRLEWDKDPFVPLVTPDEGKDARAPEMKLTAIFYNEHQPSAIINDRIVYLGSEIMRQKIIDIGKTHVILRNEKGVTRLEFAGPPEPLLR